MLLFFQSFTKHNKTFHKLFPDIPDSEDLIHGRKMEIS